MLRKFQKLGGSDIKSIHDMATARKIKGGSLSDYRVLSTIGSGSFGVCKKVRRIADGKVLVWKEVRYGGMSGREKGQLVQEVNLLRQLQHPHIVRYYDRIICRQSSTLYIVMEYCEGGDLGSLIRDTKHRRAYLQEQLIWRVFQQLLLALQECQKHRDGVHQVLHRDLKPANVFLDGRGQVKLGDFGLARVLRHNTSVAQTFVGTPYYMAPEQLEGCGYDGRSDVWSLGCLMYELCTLTPPFTASSQWQLVARIKLGHAHRLPTHYSTKLDAIVRSLLHTKVTSRPDLAEVLTQVESVVLPRQPAGGEPISDAKHGSKGRDLVSCGCGLLKREHLHRKAAELSKKEIALEEKEERLGRWEEALAAREVAVVCTERRLRSEVTSDRHQ